MLVGTSICFLWCNQLCVLGQTCLRFFEVERLGIKGLAHPLDNFAPACVTRACEHPEHIGVAPRAATVFRWACPGALYDTRIVPARSCYRLFHRDKMPPVVPEVVDVGQCITNLADITKASSGVELSTIAAPIFEGKEMGQVPSHDTLQKVMKLVERDISVGVEAPPYLW